VAKAKDVAVLGRSRPRISLLDFPREQVLAFLREQLSGHEIEHAYLFGSFASGQITAWSDIDLIVVKRTSAPFIDRPREFLPLFDLGVPLDVLVYTPDEWARLQAGKSGFFKVIRSQLLKIV